MAKHVAELETFVFTGGRGGNVRFEAGIRIEGSNGGGGDDDDDGGAGRGVYGRRLWEQQRWQQQRQQGPYYSSAADTVSADSCVEMFNTDDSARRFASIE